MFDTIPPLGISTESSVELVLRAEANFNEKRFRDAERDFSLLLAREPDEYKWYEGRAAVRVDAKLFNDALDDYTRALDLLERGETGMRNGGRASTQTDMARVLSGRALAYEGLGRWQSALDDYNVALAKAAADGRYADPFVVNSRGNVKASLAMYEDARRDYLSSAEGFRQAKGYLDKDGRSNRRLDGEMFAMSNAALMLVEMNRDEEALREMRNVSRKAPGSVDIHAALAALYWHQKMEPEAEDEWEFACERISTGCRAYRDLDWVSRVRRWPPVMVTRLQNFLRVKGSELVTNA